VEVAVADHESFLQAILANPDDLTTRLIYADWLEENGGRPEAARAELIRVQCEMAQVGEHSVHYRRLEKREQTLMSNRKWEWTRPFRGLVLFARLYCGFVEEVTVNARTFRDRGAKLFAMTPLRRVKVSGVRDGSSNPLPLAEALAATAFEQLRELDLELACLKPADVRLLANAPTLRSLSWLNLEGSEVDETALQALATGPSLRRLRSVRMGPRSIDREAIGDRLVNVLIANSQFECLEELRLSHRGITDVGVAGLARCPHLCHLRVLALEDGSQISVQGLRALATSPHLRALSTLSLKGCKHLGDEAVRALLAAPWAPALRALCLRRDRRGWDNLGITDAGLEAMAGSPALAGLRLLDLEGHGITDRGAAALEASPYLTALGRLNLRLTDVGADLRKRLRKRFGPGVCVC
jgi:uncharacterized protein (TIGR02996 family)